jgi:hypothetical protein
MKAVPSAIYDARGGAIDAYLRAFIWTERQAGLIFSIGPEDMGLDLMDHPCAMRAIFSKLVRSYALDAVEAPHSAPATTDAAKEFIRRIGRAEPVLRQKQIRPEALLNQNLSERDESG